MNKKIYFITFVLMIIFSLFCVSCNKDYEKDENGICVDFDAGRTVAQKNKQNILLLITMEGDDIYSEKFINGVVKNENFKSEVMDKFFVIHFDFSKKTYAASASSVTATKQENKIAEKKAEILENNTAVASLLNVSYTPSLYILTDEGYFISEILLSEETSDLASFVSLLNSYRLTIERFDNLFDKANNGTSIDKVNAINEIYDSTETTRRVLLSDYIKQVPELDKTNRTGFVGKFLYVAAENDAIEKFKDGDVAAAVKAYSDVTGEKFITPELSQQAYYMAGYLLVAAGSPDFDLVLSYFKKSVDAAPESEMAPSIQNIYDYILTLKASAEAKSQSENIQNDSSDITIDEEGDSAPLSAEEAE